MKSLLKSSLLFGLILTSSFVSAAELTITVDNFKGDEGNLILRLYNSESQWSSTDPNAPLKTEMISLKGVTSVTKTFELPEGVYAVSALQDLNGNNITDRDWQGRPTEPVGGTAVPNSERKGRPDFATSSFELSTATHKTIRLTQY